MIDLAVGVIIGGAFNTIVTSLVNDIVMPILSIFTGRLDFSNLFFALNGQKYETLDKAREAGVATVNYGAFITGVLNFIIMAFVVFIIVKQIGRLRDATIPKAVPAVPEAPTTKQCPHCLSEVNIKATRCPHCTSELEVAADK